LPSTREVIPEADRAPFHFDIPSHETGVARHWGSYAEWEEFHKALGQELAKRIRREA